MALEVVLNGGKPKAVENDVLTVRLEIDLESADGSGENVFSYAQLIQEQEKKVSDGQARVQCVGYDLRQPC